MISPEDLSKLEEKAKKDPLVQALIEELKYFYEDPVQLFYQEIKETVKVLASDLKILRTVDLADPEEAKEDLKRLKFLGANKDDKLFDRVNTLLMGSEKIIKSLNALKSGEPPPQGVRAKPGSNQDNDIPT